MEGKDFEWELSTRLGLMRDEWERELSRKESIERRGITVITTSGVLVTLAFGFTTAVTKGKHFLNFTPDEKLLLGIALGLFVVSGFVALLTNMPAKLTLMPLDEIEHGILPERIHDIGCAVESVRAVNRDKANSLVVATLLQLVAIAVLGATVMIIVL